MSVLLNCGHSKGLPKKMTKWDSCNNSVVRIFSIGKLVRIPFRFEFKFGFLNIDRLNNDKINAIKQKNLNTI